MWATENLPDLLQNMCEKGLTQLIDDSYKIKQTKERKLVKETLAELSSQCPPFPESDTLVFPETQKSQELLRWCHARDILGSQIPVTTGGFELRISYIRNSYLTH